MDMVAVVVVIISVVLVALLAILVIRLNKEVVFKCASCGKDTRRTIYQLKFLDIDTCPPCEEQRISTEEQQKQPATSGETNLSNDRIISLFLLWILVSGLLTGLFFLIDANDGTIIPHELRKIGGSTIQIGMKSKYAWAPEASIAVSIIGFNLAGARVGRYYFRRHKRDVYRWTAAFLMFSPIIAGIIYYYTLTWNKEQKE